MSDHDFFGVPVSDNVAVKVSEVDVETCMDLVGDRVRVCEWLRLSVGIGVPVRVSETDCVDVRVPVAKSRRLRVSEAVTVCAERVALNEPVRVGTGVGVLVGVAVPEGLLEWLGYRESVAVALDVGSGGDRLRVGRSVPVRVGAIDAVGEELVVTVGTRLRVNVWVRD